MILVDTSVWVDHLRRGNLRLAEHLRLGEVLTHPFVIGEIACDSLRRRDLILESLRELPFAIVAQDDEVYRLLEEKRLWGKGIGWIDVHLIASVLLTRSRLWTVDRKLANVASGLHIALC